MRTKKATVERRKRGGKKGKERETMELAGRMKRRREAKRPKARNRVIWGSASGRPMS